MARRILFYIEPVTFRHDPFLLWPWLNWVAQIVRAHSDSCPMLKFGFSSNPWFCRSLRDQLQLSLHYYAIKPADILRPFDMDRICYAQDLARRKEDETVNEPLDNALSKLIADFDPDAVISFTENRYLSAKCSQTTLLFSETQPLPRTFTDAGFFLDVSGHQVESMLVTQAPRIRALRLEPDLEEMVATMWQTAFTRRQHNRPDTTEMRNWFRQQAQGAPVIMIAAQPPDWLTFEGIGDRTSIDGQLMRWLDIIPTDWRAVVTYHPAHQLSRDLEATLAEQMPNLLLLPEAWRCNQSEWLMQSVDAVATVSSAVGFTALLAGKPTITLGKSNLSGFASSRLQDVSSAAPLSRIERIRLLAFLTNRYCMPAKRFLDEPGFLNGVIDDIIAMGHDFYFDFRPRSLGHNSSPQQLVA